MYEPLHSASIELRLLILNIKYRFLRFEAVFNVHVDYAVAGALRTVRQVL
jgi:hypothetical protein